MTYEELDDMHALCRDLLHAWKPYDAEITRTHIVRVLRCVRCKTIRRQKLTRKGEIVGASYSYPKGYTMRGQGRMTSEQRAQLRVANINARRK